MGRLQVLGVERIPVTKEVVMKVFLTLQLIKEKKAPQAGLVEKHIAIVQFDIARETLRSEDNQQGSGDYLPLRIAQDSA